MVSQAEPSDNAAPPPTLTKLQWLGSTQLLANWSPASGSGPYYLLTLFADGNPQTTVNCPIPFGKFDNPGVGSDTVVYTVAVASCDTTWVQTGPYSNAIPVITHPPTGVTIEYDGTDILVQWVTPLGATAAQGGSVSFWIDGTLVGSDYFPGTQARYRPAAVLLPTKTYAVSVSGESPNTTGPQIASPIGVIQTIATTALVNYDGFAILANCQPVDSNSPALYLYADGQVINSALGTAGDTQVHLNLIQALDPSKVYAIRTARATATSRGPLSLSEPVFALPPTLTSVSYDGTSVAASWQNPAFGPAFSGGIMILTADGVFVKSQGVLGTSGKLTPDHPLDAGKTYMLTVSPNNGNSTGLASQPLQVLAATMAISSAAYDGQRVSVGWTGSDAAGVTGYNLTLFRGTAPIQAAFVAGGSGEIPANLDPNGTYTAALQAAGNSSVGPPGTAVSVLPASPAITGLAYTPGSLALTWHYAGGAAAAGFTAYLFEGSQQVASQTFPISSTSGNMAVTLDPWKRYNVRIQATATNSVGPLSASQQSIAGIPKFEMATYDGQTLYLRWTSAPEEAVTGYAVTVIPPTGNPVTINSNLPELSYTWTAPAGTSQVKIKAVGVVASGPLTKALIPLTTALSISNVAYDGENLSVQASGGPCQFSILCDSAPVHSQVSASGKTSIPIALDPARAYTVSVVPISGSPDAYHAGAPFLSGPAAGADVISAVPSISSVQCDSGSQQVVVSWLPVSGGSGLTGFNVTLTEANGTQVGNVAVTGAGSTSGTIPNVTLPPGASYAVQVQGTGTNVSGPLSARAPVVAEAIPFASADYDGTILSLTWDRPLDPAVIGFVVTLDPQGSATKYTTTDTKIVIPAASGLNHTVILQAVGKIASGPVTTLAVLSDTVAVQSALYDGEFLTAAWSSSSDPNPTYELSVWSGGDLVAAFESVAAGGTWPISLGAAANYTAKVRVISGISKAPLGAAFGVVSYRPSISKVAATAAQVVVTLDTTGAPAGVTGYQVYLYEGDALVAGPVATTTNQGVTSATISYAFSATSRYSVHAQAVGVSPTTQLGPYGPSVPVIAAAPQVVACGFNGTNLTASWTSLSDPAVAGYAVYLLQGGNVAAGPWTTSLTSIEQPASLALGSAYQIVVQGIGAHTAGPNSAPADPLADSVGYFFPKQSASPYAYLFRGDIRGPGPADISLYLPNLFPGSAPTLPNVAPFVMQVAGSGGPNAPFVIAVAQSSSINVWSIQTNAIRSDLRTAYIQFLTQLEQVTGGLVPGAVPLVRQVIAQGIPLNFAETLYYAYGFDPVAGYVDLRPGMRLRVDFEGYQLVSSSQNQALLNGYTGSGSSFFEVDSLATNGTSFPASFDPFLAQLSVPAVSPNSGGGSGIIDFQGANYQMAYIRLFYPPTFPSSDSGGSASLSQNVVLLWANTIATLEQATTQFLANRNFTGISGIQYAFFRGRATFLPEVQCSVNGNAQWVSLGTSVRNLIERYANVPLAKALSLGNLRYDRPIGNLVDNPSEVAATFAMAKTNRVQFGYGSLSDYQYAGLSCFDLPVLAGDTVQFEE
ncbi:MAG TPA: fibronectin type III domain-containing protein [Fimbriimonadaceae bacterium]|nr:fibronectin type III domain-containing protein [Fimbriimonadaceae bacterium]